jgi:predicted hydrocarbon binding protein
MVSKFLFNIFAKGSIHLEEKEGRLFIWNNPVLFIPLSSFAVLQKGITDKWNEDGKELIYWIGKIQGHNSSELFMQRFGYSPNPENFGSFIDGSTMVGMGTMELLSYDLKSNNARIISNNSTLAKTYFNLFKKTDNPIDYYMCGILAGGTEPLINTKITCKEDLCIAKGDERCEYHLYENKNENIPRLIKNIGFSTEKVIDVSKLLYIKRQSFLKNLFEKQVISLSEGALLIKNLKGVLIPPYLLIIINHAIKQDEPEALNVILEKTAEDYISNLDIKMTFPKVHNQEQIDIFFSSLNLFGLGQFVVKRFTDEEMIIENTTNPYPLDYVSLFGIQKEPVDIFSCYIIKSFIKKYLNKDSEVIEKSCIANGNQSCYFKVAFKK